MCQHRNVELGKTIMASGKFHLWYRCYDCRKNVTDPGPYVSKELYKDLDFELLPVFEDYRPLNPPCVVCGTIGTELHHFAPKELFPETFDRWPTAYLCDKCHKEWHSKITTPFRVLKNREKKVKNE